MLMETPDDRTVQGPRRLLGIGLLASAAAGMFALGASAPQLAQAPADAASTPKQQLPAPPANGVMGFVVQDFVDPIVPGMDACPTGTAPRLRDEYLRTLPAADHTNICSQPDMFDHAAYPAVQSKYGLGLDLDGGKQAGDTCAHEEFQSPTGERGIDNQEYRAMGCTPEIRGADGQGGDALTGMKQFHNSGEWTQVILLKGVDSLQNDNDVEVIYANTADRPVMDSKGNFLRNVSFTVNDTGARHRNVLHGQIRNGVLTTEPTDIRLAQTWGQGGARDIRGNRSQYHYEKGRLRLEFQPDGTLRGFVGGYRPLFDVIVSGSLGGAGTAVVAGIDCSAQLASLRKYADGMRDPKTGKCTAISSAMRIGAIPAFVTDLPSATRTASK
jgi:hypothetical protein